MFDYADGSNLRSTVPQKKEPDNQPPSRLLRSITQPLDQSIRTAGSDDRSKFVASRREVADRSIKIDIDHAPARGPDS